MASEPPTRRPDAERRFEEHVGRKAARRAKAAREGEHPVWHSLGLFGLVGWSVAIPTLVGLAVGTWIDSRWPGRVSWTITLLFVGIVLGCLNAWRWIQEEGRDDDR